MPQAFSAPNVLADGGLRRTARYPPPDPMNFRRSTLALGAFFVAAVLVGCGDSVPKDAVVSVDGTEITNANFDHWMNVAAATSQGQTGQTTKVSIPKPPDYAACVASKQTTAPKPAKGQPKPTTAQFK